LKLTQDLAARSVIPLMLKRLKPSRPYPFMIRHENKLYKLFYGKFVECYPNGKLKISSNSTGNKKLSVIKKL
jgi:hypothetical protein